MNANKLHIFEKQDAPKQIYQLKIVLKGIRPPIWRRLLISNHATFADLHHAIQDSFYWSNYHLHEFTYRLNEKPHDLIHIEGKYPDDTYPPENDFNDIREDEIRLCDVFSSKQKTVNYLYDFGDNREHAIKLEKIFPNINDFRSFSCVGGKRATPPEDCGGPYGYQDLIEILENPNHPEHEEMKAWAGKNFDPEIIKCPMNKMTPKIIEQTFGSCSETR